MSGIAEVLLNHGFTVQGSDAQGERRSPSGSRRRARRSSSASGPRTSRARRSSSSPRRSSRGTPSSTRRGRGTCRWCGGPRCWPSSCGSSPTSRSAGTHGKTTTTSMVAALLDAGGMDPTVVNGGVIHAYGSNARIGQRRVDGGRGRRERRHLRQAAGDGRDRDQHRPRASSSTGATSRGCEGGFDDLRLEHPLLRARGLLHRPSRGAGAGRAHRPTGGSRPTASTRRPTCRGEPASTRTAARSSTWR